MRLLFLLLFFSSCHTKRNLGLIWTLLITFSSTFYVLSRFHLLLRSLYAGWRLPLAIQHWHFLCKYWCHMVIQKVSTPHTFSQGVFICKIPTKVHREASYLFRWLTSRKSLVEFHILFTSLQTAAVFPSTHPFISIISELAWGVCSDAVICPQH